MERDLDACLPPELRGPDTSITPIGNGLSGARVYRVEAGGRSFVLKCAGDRQPLATFCRRVEVQRLAASAGVAPAVLHADEKRRAIVSPLVADRSFAALYQDPHTREAALALLAGTVRRVHELPLEGHAAPVDPRALLDGFWSALAGLAVPAFAADAIRRVLDEDPPASGRAAVLSHNDLNPTNMVWDGERILLLDWDTADANDPFYDLAAVSLFLLMDDETSRRLLAAYDGAPVPALPARFVYDRRLVAALCGAGFLRLARDLGHPGASAPTLAEAPSLPGVYQGMRTGAVSLATPDGRWQFGLALLKAGAAG